MRKWLVGLLAAGLCLSSAWADTVTYTVESTSAVSVSGTEPEGASAEYASTYSSKYQLTGGNSMTLTLKGYEGTTITGLTLSMRSNASKGAGSLNASSGDAVIAAIEDSPFNPGWHDGWSTEYVDVTPSVTETAVTGDIVITIAASVNSLYCQSFTIEYEAGEPQFSVTFDKENMFKVALGEASSVTAIPKHGVEPYTFAWESDTPELNGGTTDTLEIPATLAEGDYTVLCQVTDDNGAGDVINAPIGFTVEAIPVITGDTYTKISSLDDLTAGEYVITGASTDGKEEFAMLNTIGGSGAKTYINRKETAETIEDGSIVVSDASIVWTLAQDGSAWTISQEGFGFVYYSGSENSAGAEAEASDKSKWTISAGEDGLFAVVNVATEGRNLRYNSGSPRFACYAPSSSGSLTGKALAFYKKAGEAGLSVTLDKANGFTVDLGTADSITATAKNGVEPYTYAWTSDTPDLNGTGETLAIPATLAEGDYTVQVEVTDAESNKVNKQIGFSVVVPAQKYAVNVAVGNLNGGVTADKEQAEEGELVTLTSSPDAGYKLGTFLLDGEAIEGNTFNMPAHDVLVSAEFVEVTGEVYELVKSADDFEEGAEYLVVAVHAKGNFTSALKNEANGTRIGVEEVVVNEDNTVVTDDDSIVWTIQAGAEEGQYVLYNAAKGVYAAATKDDNVAQLLEDGTAALAQWTLNFDNVPTVGIYSVSYPERWLSRNSTAASAFFATYKGTQTAPFLFKKAGPSGPSVSLSASATEVEVNEPVTITATAKNFSAEPEWAWEGNDGGNADGAVYTVNTAVAGDFTIKATATAGDEIAEKEITVTVTPALVPHAITVTTDGNGTAEADVATAKAGEPVNLTVVPNEGFKLASITVNGEAITGTSFEMPDADVTVAVTFKEITGEVYKRVESADDFEEGAEYLVVSFAKDKFTSALKNEASGSRIGVEEVVIADDNTVTTDSDAIVWKIQAGAADGQYVLFNEAAGVYAAGPKSEGNNAQLLADGTDALAQWTLDFADVPAVAIGSVAYPERQLNRNSTAQYNYFATYKGSGTKPFLFKKAGPSAPSVSLSASATEVEVGGELTVTATAKNFSADVEWAWEGNDGGSADGAVYTVNTAVAGDFTIKATATAGDEIAEKEITVTVTPALVPHAITVTTDGNGTAEADVATAKAGEPVNLTVVPNEGFKLASITVNGEAITGTSFEMPDADVTVAVTFKEITGEVYKRVESADDFEEGAEYLVVAVHAKGNFTSALKNETNGTRIGVEEVVVNEDNTVVTDDDSIVWTIQAGAEEGQYVLYNAAKGVYAAATKDDNVAQLLEDGTAALAQWTLKFDDAPAVGIWSVSYPERWLSRNSTAASAYFATYKGTQTAPFLFKKAGPSAPSVSLSASATEVEVGGELTITATAKNFSADVAWAWEGNDGGSADGAVYTVNTAVAGEFTIKATATAGDEIAEKSITVTVSEPGPQPGEPAIVFGGDTQGVVGQVVNFTVTAVNISDPTLYLDGFEFPADSSLTDGDLTKDYPNVSFTPDAAGDYVFNYSAGEGDEYVASTLTITVTDEPGPQPTEPGITKMTIASGKMTIEFIGEGAQVLLSDDMETWAPVDGAISPFSFDMKEAGKKYIGVR